MARQLVQATLPHKNPGDIPAWTRRNGTLVLTVQPGFDGKRGKSYGCPYGTIPRLLLFWMTTEASRTKSRRLELGRSLAAFMTGLGLDSTRGGPRSDARRLHEQMQRLFQARISLQTTLADDGRTGEARRNMSVVEDSMLWWDDKSPQQTTLWGNWIELGERFYNAIIATPVPMDIRALKSLKRSPLALDLYAWLTFEAWRAHTAEQSRFVNWEQLHAQFGGDYAEVRNFRLKVKAAITKIRQVYPGLLLGDEQGGIKILPSSRPAIPSSF